MKSSEARAINLPTRAIMDRHDELAKRVQRKTAKTISEVYAKSVATEGGWQIQEQPIKTLPRSLTDLIPVVLRDEGNALIEETRQINNRYAGVDIRSLQALLVGDLETIDLKERVLVWAEKMTHAVLFKARRQIAENCVKAYSNLYRSFIHEIDTKIAHGTDHMYSVTWSSAMEAIPYWLIDAIFVQTGFVTGAHESDQHFVLGGTLLLNRVEAYFLTQQFTLYNFETIAYSREIILTPLHRTLLSGGTLPSIETMRRQTALFLADLLEAFPYLLSSTRVGKHLFSLPGTTCVAAFDYIANDGFARFMFSDSKERFEREIVLGSCRGILEVGFDGRIAFYMMPWMTLARVFGTEASLVLTYCLLKIAHEKVVADYLKIKDYYLDPRPIASPIKMDEIDEGDGFTSYTDWVREAQDEAVDLEIGEGSDAQEKPLIAQMRRTRFFKLLRNCDVTIESGKGSEIKLLRPTFHPFRMGNHYGSNPTVPSYLIANILKRLQITRAEWRHAIANVSLARQ